MLRKKREWPCKKESEKPDLQITISSARMGKDVVLSLAVYMDVCQLWASVEQTWVIGFRNSWDLGRLGGVKYVRLASKLPQSFST